MKPLIEKACILRTVSTNEAELNETQYDLYVGEWVYCSSEILLNLLPKIFFLSKEMLHNKSVLGINTEKINSINAKQSIRRKVRHITGCKMYPERITIEEEVEMNFALTDNINKADCIEILEQFDLSKEHYCEDLKYTQKIILDVLIAIHSNISILILDNVIDAISVDYRSDILDLIYQKSMVEGLSVLISTDNVQIKNNYLGRVLN